MTRGGGPEKGRVQTRRGHATPALKRVAERLATWDSGLFVPGLHLAYIPLPLERATGTAGTRVPHGVHCPAHNQPPWVNDDCLATTNTRGSLFFLSPKDPPPLKGKYPPPFVLTWATHSDRC